MNGHATLNRCYRHVWSEATQSWMVAPETARRAGKGGRARRVLQAVIGALASVALSGGMSTLTHAQQAPPSVTQLPVANAVARGQVNITQTNTASTAVMNVKQTSQSAVVNWNTFNVGQNAQVNFNQPNSSAVTLNRVLDNNPSQVWGRITAPGQVFISNANGVYFSPTASVDVGALTATTHSISDDDFMSGKRTFNRDGATGKVINEGNITAALGGYVALLAPEVQNAGVIVAQAGTVALAAGEAITLNFDPSQSLTGITTTPSTMASLVENKLAVLAPDGRIVLSAVAMNKLQAGVVKNNGRLEASSMVNKGGTIVLEGDDITLERSSKIEATGPKGGGTVLVGGDWQGSGNLSQATRVKMEEGAVINASATENGDGGKVVLWTDVHNTNAVTHVAGAIYARGGSFSGDGGRIETSGHILNVDASKGDASAPHGAAGLWLFDPYNVTITSADANGAFSSTAGTDSWEPSATGSSILNTTIVSKLNAGTNVEITTTGAGAEAGNITVAAPITANNTGTGNLSMFAEGDISLNANINTGANLLLKAAGNISQLGSTTVNTNGGSVTYWSDSDSSGAGSISLLTGTSTNQTSIVTNGGHIVMGGGGDAATSAAMGVNGIRLDGFTTLNSGAGNVSLRGTSTSITANGGVGLRLVNSTITGYDINLFGQGPANTGGSASGSATTTTLTATHNINLAADVFASGVNNHVTATATGSVVVNAAQTWGTNNLVLSAGTDVDLNANVDASSGGGLTVRFGQSSADGGASAYRVNGVNVKIALPSGAGSKFRWKKGSAGGSDNELVFNNGYLAFAPNASGTRTAPNTSALNEQGQLNQPNFYDLDTVNNVTVGRDAWYKLTYSNRSLEFQVGTGTSGTSWNGNNTYASPGGTGGYLDISQYLPGVGTGPGGGAKASGTILSVLPLTVSSQNAQLISRYVLGAGDAYLRSDTSVKSISSTLSNVGLWVGTGDDWVGGTDGPIKTIGNFSSSGFTANTVVGQSASVLRVDENNSTGASVLFYSTDSSASATFSNCCSFSNATGVNPANQTITQQNDGSYSLYTGLGDVTAGATKGFSWFYVAAPSQKVNAVAQSVVSTLTTYSFNGNSPTLSYAYTGNAYSLANLWSSVSLNTSGGSVMLQPGQATNGYSFVYSGNPVTSLTNAGTYRLQIALTSDIASNYLLNNVGAATLTITPAPLTISGTTAADKTYNSTNVATVTAGSLDPTGFLQGQTVGVSATGTFDNVNVGLRAVTPVYTLIDGTNGGLARNYAITNVTTTPASITPASLTLSGTKVYDGLTSIAGSTLTARGVNNQTFSITGTGDLSNLANPNVQTNSLLSSVTGLSLGTSSNGGVSSNYNAISFTGSTYAITPKALTVSGISVVDKVYNGGTQAFLNTSSASYTGMISGDDLSMNTSAAVASFNNKNVGLAKPVTVSGLTLSGTDSTNYTLTAPTSLTGNITRLSSVTWTGGATGNWFDPANWAGGAVPDLANVANVVIPTGKTVSFGSTVVAPASAGTVQVDSINANSSQLGGLSMSSGTLEIGSGNANLYSLMHTGGAFSVASNLSVTDAFSQTAAGTIGVTGNATLTDTTGGLALGALTVGGALALQSTGGGITQVSGTSVLATGASSFSARNSGAPASIVLAEAGNNFQGPLSADGSLVTLQDSNALTLGQIVTTGDLTITSGSHLTQTGAMQVGGASTLTATAGDITLAHASNDFTGALTVSAANISLRDANALPLGGLTATGNTAIVANGHVTQTGPISISGTTAISAGAGNITLSNVLNDFTGNVTASGADISLRDANTLTLAALTSTGQSAITTDGDVAFGTTSVRGNLSVISGNGNISQTQTMGVTGSASFNAGTGTVDLSNASNVFGATPQIQAASSEVSSGGPYNLASALGSDPQKPVLSGMAPANTTVSVFDNGTLLGTTTADNVGAWSLVPTTFMIPGNHIITASSASAVGVSGLSSPLPILVNARFDTPNMVGAALQTQQSQSSVVPPVAGALQPGQSPVVHTDQLTSMTPQQLQSMTPLQTSLLTPAQLVSLEPTQLASLSPSQFQAMQPSQVGQLAPSQMVSLSAQQVAAISSAAPLSLDQLQVLAPAQVAAVQPSQFATMNAAQMASLGDAQLQSLTPGQVAAIAPTQLAGFTPEQVSLMGPGLTQNLSPQQFGGLTALQLISLSDSQVSSISPAQLQQLNPTQLSVISPEQRAAMNPLQLLALGETANLQVSALSPQDVNNLTAQQVQNLQPEHLQALSGLQMRGFTPEHIESMSFSQVSSLSPVQLQALTSQQISSLSVAQAASLNDSQLAVMSASQLNVLPKGGALPITVLGSASSPAAGIEFEKRADVVEVRVSDMVPGGASASAGSGSMATELTVFTVTTADNQTVEFKGAISNKQLMIAAPTEAAKALTRSDLAQIMKVALTQLGGEKTVDPTELSGIVLDLRS